MNENESFNLFNENKDEINIKDKEKFDDKIIAKINQYKESNYEPLYLKNSFCDININDKWIVGKILNISEDIVTATEFENSSGYVKVFLFDSEKISYYRKYTKPNENRINCQRDTNEELKSIQSFIQLLLKYNFGDYEKQNFIDYFNYISAYDMIQNLRGKVYYWCDKVLNINDNNSGIDICINIIELLLNLIKNFYNYLKKNNDIIIKYKELIGTKFEDIILVDKRYAIITFEKDAFEIYNKIMGQYPNYNDFYIKYAKEIKKITNNRYNKKIQKICNQKIYEGNITEYKINDNQAIPIYPLCYFIDYFNYLNGYQSISNFIVSNTCFSFDMIESYLYLFKRIYVMLDEKNNQLNNKLTSQLNQLRVYLQKRMNKLTENEIKNYPKEKMINLILILSNILPFDDNIKINTFEELYLNYISACFFSQNLEKKIYAMNTFNSIITSIDNNQKNKIIDKSLYYETDKYVKNMNYEILINCLVKIRVLHFILEENVHVEIIKRSLPIILLLYKKNFNLQDFEKIYENRKKIIDFFFLKLNEADKKNDEILIKTLKDIISKLSIFQFENDREYTFNLMKDYIKNKIINIENINLIKDFTINYLNNEKKGFDNKENKKDFSFNEKKYLGIQFLWNYMLDNYYIDNSLNNNNFNYIEIINQCINSLIEIFNMEILNHDDFKRKVLFNIINCISNNQSEVQCLTLLKNLILKSNIFNQLIKKIHDNNKDTILDLIINNFNKYYIKVFLNEENKVKSFEENLNSIFQGLYSHQVNLKIRIELFIKLLNKEIDLEMHLDNFIVLWNYLIQNDFSKEILYKQLLDNMNNFLYTFKKNIFDKILLDNALFKIDNILSFTIFKKFMLTINIANGIFILINNKDLRVDEKNNNEIIGLNKLWHILIETNNNEIQNQVSSILSNICLNVKNPNSKNSIIFWSNFIQELIQYLKLLKMNETKIDNEKINNNFELFNNINQISNMKNNQLFLKDNTVDCGYEIGIKGLVILIKKIYEKFGSKGNIINDVSGLQISNDLNDPNEEFLKYIFNYNKKEYNLKISFNEPLYIVRYKISNYFEIPVNTIQFQYDTGKNEIKKFDLCNDFELFNTLIMRGQKMINLEKVENVNICLINNPIVNVEKNPKQLLDSLSDLLIELLRNKNKIYTLDIWKLLNHYRNNNDDLINKISQYIMENFINLDLQKDINYIFDFNNTSIYYKNYILINVINALNNNKLYHEYLILFINSQIWNDKIMHFIHNFSIKDEINEKNEVLQTTNNIIEIFKLLIPLNKENIFDLIIDKILQFLYEIFYDSINKDIYEDIYNSQSKTIENILKFICSYKTIFIMLIQKILQNQTSQKQFLYILVNGIIQSKNILIKKQFKMFIRRIYDDDLFKPENIELEVSFSTFILFFLLSQKNLDLLSEISKNNNSISFNFFFEVCDTVIEKVYPLKINFNYKGYINTILIPQILSNETNEELLSGYFLIIFSIFKNYNIKFDNIKENKFDFSNYIFYDLLFSKYKENPLDSKSLIIKNENTISNSLNLLTYLIINNESKRLEILKILHDFHNFEFLKSSQFLDWKKSFKDDIKSKFVGLKNLGCTCYMNSLLQILFLITPFRESILNTESIIEEKNVLFQLKYVFNSLKYSESKFFNPIEFTKNFDNEELNIREQMDIDEFFNLLIDKLENHLQKTKNKNLIKYFFQGRNIDYLEFQEGCTHHRKNEIPFYSIQLLVKNKNNLFQSLDYFIDGEVMSGDNAIFCQTCNRKIPSIKYQSFKILPRILIFVLKRFEFNYNTMTKIKINDYYEFPIELDMTNYTYDYLNNKNNYDRNKNNNLYKLKGFVVHSGTCENGHYYSFIYDNNYNQWFEFNDISVKEFNIENMNKEAFGGYEYIINNNTKKQEKKELNKNAYLLFYEKVDMSNCENYNDVEICNNVSNYIKEEPILKQINNNLIQYNIERIIFSVQYHRFILQFLINILNLCYENDKLLTFLQYFTRTNDINIISKDLFNLRNKIIGSNLNNYINLGKIQLLNKKNLDNTQKEIGINILSLFRFLITYFYNVLVRAENKRYLAGTVDLIKFFLNQYNECSQYLIEEFCNTSSLMEYIISCPILEMKKLFVGIIYCAMIKLYNDFNQEKKNNKDNNISLNENNQNNTGFYDINAMDDIELNDKPNTERIQTSSFTKFFNSLSSNNNIVKESSEIELKVVNNLQSNHIPKVLLKFINNLIYFIQIVNDDKDCMFIYYILYRFSLISPYTKDFLITNIPLLTYLMYHLFPKYSKYNIPYNFVLNLNIDYIQLEHNDLSSKNDNNAISKDKSAYYRDETYIYMLCYNLLSGQRALIYIDKTYQFENLEFVLELFLGIRTKQDAFCFSHLVNKLCYNNSDITQNFSNAFMKIIEKNESIDLDNIMIVYKRFLIDIDDDKDFQESKIKSSLKHFFKLIFKFNKVYSHCDYCIQFAINIFICNHLKMYKYVDYFKSYFEDMKEWIEKNPIPPLMYEIKGLQMYKKEQNYQNENLNIDIKSFKEKHLRHSKRNKIYIDCIINSKILFFFIFYRKNNSS